MLVPIACRFVPCDQWFLTHLDDGSKVKQVKLWILSKCNLVQSPGPRTQRPVSPITFAPSIRPRPSVDSLDDGYNEDDEFSDQDLPPSRHPAPSGLRIGPYLDAKPGPSSQPVQPGSCPLVDQYTLLSFSTGSVLEDEFSLSWYNLRPYELLEMHPVGIVAPLQRDVLEDYIQPYFQAKVRILRAVWNHRSGRFEPPCIDTQEEHSGHKAKDKSVHRLDTFSSKSSTLQSEKRHKTKVDWKARWVVINYGVLSLSKEHVAGPPLRQFALNTMVALRGADALERAFSIASQPRVVCIKFRPRTAPMMRATSPPPASPSSPIAEDLKTNVQQPLPGVGSGFDLKHATEQEHPREKSGEYAYDPNDACGGEGEWIVVDMLDDHAFSSILRILHRQAARPISSSFVSSPSIITVPHHTVASAVARPFVSYDTIPYPEWRMNVVENARKAGMGDVGKPMAWVLWTEKGLGETLLGNIRHHRQAFSREMQYKTGIVASHTNGSDDESDDDSEMEWEGWMRDLERQSWVRERSERSAASRQGYTRSSTSSPSSEASPSGSPRSQLATGSYFHTRYRKIGNVIQASGSHRPPDKVINATVSTVSVGMVPSPRRRSSTLSAGLATTTKHDHDKGRQDKPSISLGTSAGMQWSPVRHTYSSSNLKMSSPHGSDAGESPMRARPSSPSKRQSGFMRGMSLRAGRIVRGLESAIDFVDEKGV